MVTQTKHPFVLLEAYFEREDAAETKSEYHNGVIVSMAHASPAHAAITFNLAVELGQQLHDRSCQGFSSDMRVYVEKCHAVYYPDMTVACDPPRYVNTRMATLLNPTFIVEVLSPSTEHIDRVTKFDCYRTLESLSAYLLISQDEPRAELYTRQPNGVWQYEVVKGLEATLTLSFTGSKLRLAGVYNGIRFSSAPSAKEGEEAK